MRVEEQAAAVIQSCEKRFGGIDILVNNAGIGINCKTVEEMTPDEFRETKRAPAASREMSDLLTASGDLDAVVARVREYKGLADSIKLSVPVNGLGPDEIRDAQKNLIELIERIADAPPDT